MQALPFDTSDYNQIKQNFLRELKFASGGKLSSISFIKHQIPERPFLTYGIIQAIVIGGTNYTTETVKITSDGTRKTLRKDSGTLPLFTTRQTLVDFLSAHLDFHADAVVINFGFPIKPAKGSFGELDATILYSTKEHAFSGLNEQIGELVKTLYRKSNNRVPFVSVANDTVCLIASGDGTENCSFVDGTGFNICLRLPEKKKTVLINLEAGNFNKFPLPTALKKIDAVSEKPGNQLFEKAVSGRYLASYFNEMTQELHLITHSLSSSKELSSLAAEENGNARELARAILTHSAYLVASVLAGLYEFYIDSRIIPRGSQFTLIGEGGLLWSGWHYRENIQKQLHALGIPEDTITIKHIKNSSTNGALGLITGFSQLYA